MNNILYFNIKIIKYKLLKNLIIIFIIFYYFRLLNLFKFNMESNEENNNNINNIKPYIIIDDLGMIFEQSENFPNNLAGHIKDIVDKSNKLNLNNYDDNEDNRIIDNNVNNLISIDIKYKNNNIVILEDKEKNITIASKI